jgi:hypothetical protein
MEFVQNTYYNNLHVLMPKIIYNVPNQAQSSRNFLPVREYKGSLLHSQQTATGSYS